MSNYDMEMQNLKCECNVDESVIKIGGFEGSKTLYKSFYDVLKYSNYKVLFCYKLAFRLINFKINIGCIIVCIFFAIFLIFIFIYSYRGIKLLKLEVAKFMFVDKNQKNSDNLKTEGDKEPNYINTLDKLKPEKQQRKKTHNIDIDYTKMFNKSTNKELDEKSLNIKQRKSNKSVVNPPKKSSRKSLEYKQTSNNVKGENQKKSNNKKVSIKLP